MKSDYIMTKQQADEKIKCLEEVFDVVRLLDADTLQVVDGNSHENYCECYKFWNRNTRWENCVSSKAVKFKTQKTKLEYFESQIYQVIAKYVEIDNKPYSMEMIKCMDDDSMLVGSEGRDKLVSKIAGYEDKLYDYNMEHAEKAGIPVGTYVYSTATTNTGALKEARLDIRKMQGYKVSYPVVFDLEYQNAQSLSPQKVSEMALTFCNEVRKAGYYPMVYCNTYWYDNFIDWSMLSGLDVWIARYGDTIQAPDANRYSYTIWQSTDGNTESGLNTTRGLVDGVPSYNDVDLDFGYVDYTKKITPRWKSVSSYTPATKPNTDSYNGSSSRHNGWVETESGKTYYYTNGKKAKGWKTIEGKTYYFDQNTGVMYQKKLFTVDGKIYYVNKYGIRVSDRWEKYDGKKYYFTSDGTALKGMKKVDGKYYWFHTTDGYMFQNRRVTRKNGDIYYFGEDGTRCENGMYKITEKGAVHTYYFQKDGKAYKGWLTYKGNKYYFYKGSAALSGTRAENITLTSSGNLVSVFDKKGVCIKQYKK